MVKLMLIVCSHMQHAHKCQNSPHVKSSQMALINCADRAMKNVQDLSCHKHETKPVAVSYICGIQISQLEPTGSSKKIK